MNPTDKELIEQIRRHFNISPFASLTDPYLIRLVELLQYTKSIMPKELTEEECEAIINRHNWFNQSWKQMAKTIHDEILKKSGIK